MPSLSSIKEPIKDDLNNFEPYFRSLMKSKAPLLNIITNYIIKRKGKQMRPMLVFLTSRLFGEVNQSSYNAATLIELMHTATLIHDDVVDNSYQRRGMFSINALWKNKIAVLVGDYLLSRGLLVAVDNNEFELLKVVSEAVREMSEGELLQIEKARKLDITEDVYFDIIQKKTASLIAACAKAGATSVKANEIQLAKIKDFGMKVGIAFQIRDDIFDYTNTGNIGKPSGNDIREKKMTLPLIYVLNNSSSGEKRKIINIVKKKSEDKNRVDKLVKHVIDKGGIEYASKVMDTYKNEALNILSEMPQNEANKALVDFVNYTTIRNK